MKKLILLCLSLIFLTATMMCAALYIFARIRVNALGLDSGRQPLEGTLPVRGIHTVAIGALLPRVKLAQELAEAGFELTTTNDNDKSLTYSLIGKDDMMIRGGKTQAHMNVHWTGLRISDIETDGERIEAIEVPSPVLFRLHSRDEDLGSFFSQRQFFADDAEMKGSVLPDVLIGTEDRDFEHHGGVAPRSMLGAVLDTLRGGRMRGAGTLSMQLARTLIWPGEDPGRQGKVQKYWRKVNEWFLASALEQRITKDEILRQYVNSVDLGSIETKSGRRHQLKGFKAAAHYSFGVDDLRKLTLAQAAALVAVLPAPNRYQNDLAAMRSRRDSVVLDDYAKLHPERANAVRTAREQSLGLIKSEDDNDNGNSTYGFFLDAWRSSPTFKHDLRGDDLSLTVDPELQASAEAALRDELTTLHQRIGAPVEGALVALDPMTGKVRALVGGDRFPEPDRARMAFRTGSIVKPFYGALALDEGSIYGGPVTPLTLLNLSDCTVDGWTPDDGEGDGYLTAREALARSSDCGAVGMAKSIGLEKACEEIELSLQIHPVCSGPALIGGARGSEATPLHMAEAYAAFVNGGTTVEADFASGEAKVKKTTRLFSPQAAYQEVQMMRSVIGGAPAERATAAMARVWSGLPKGAQVAGKTGTDGQGKFWIGVAQPHLIVVVLISVPSQTALRERDGFTGGMIAGRVWADFVRRSLQRSPYYFAGAFSQPSGVTWLEVDRTRGCLQPGTKDNEIFLVGRVPRPCF